MSLLSPQGIARPAGVATPTDPLVPGPGLPARPGSLDAYSKPSLVNGVRVPRKLPLILGSDVAPTVLARG